MHSRVPSPRIRTTLVGSYPAPAWLVAAPSDEALRDATRVVLATQERAGIDLVCDGEMYRFDLDHPETNGMIDWFVRPLTGLRTAMGLEEILTWQERSDMHFRRKPAGVVEGEIGPGTLDMVTPSSALRALTRNPVKFTLTGPHMLAKTLEDRHYGSVERLALALADLLAAQVARIDADVVQIDEANLPGHPDEWPWALEAVNRVLDAVPAAPAVHLCFGNYGGQRVQSGSWDKLLSFFNGLHADHLVLECKRRPEDEVRALAGIDSRLGLGVGVIDVKDNEIEKPDAIAGQLEKMENILGEGRIRYVHPDCGLWMLKRSVADGKIRALVEGRDLYLDRA